MDLIDSPAPPQPVLTGGNTQELLVGPSRRQAVAGNREINNQPRLPQRDIIREVHQPRGKETADPLTQ